MDWFIPYFVGQARTDKASSRAGCRTLGAPVTATLGRCAVLTDRATLTHSLGSRGILHRRSGEDWCPSARRPGDRAEDAGGPISTSAGLASCPTRVFNGSCYNVDPLQHLRLCDGQRRS